MARGFFLSDMTAYATSVLTNEVNAASSLFSSRLNEYWVPERFQMAT